MIRTIRFFPRKEYDSLLRSHHHTEEKHRSVHLAYASASSIPLKHRKVEVPPEPNVKGKDCASET